MTILLDLSTKVTLFIPLSSTDFQFYQIILIMFGYLFAKLVILKNKNLSQTCFC